MYNVVSHTRFLIKETLYLIFHHNVTSASQKKMQCIFKVVSYFDCDQKLINIGAGSLL